MLLLYIICDIKYVIYYKVCLVRLRARALGLERYPNPLGLGSSESGFLNLESRI